jgi:hypothetical protein
MTSPSSLSPAAALRLAPYLRAVGIALWQFVPACTLTSGSFEPTEAVAPLGPLDASTGSESGARTPSPAGIMSNSDLLLGDAGVTTRAEAEGDAGATTRAEAVCDDDADCELRRCVAGTCQPATCLDGIANQTESDIDCGGPCPTGCALDAACTGSEDCGDGLYCSEESRCAAPSCSDAVKNGDEAFTDCGGACPGCPAGAPCAAGGDCETGVCGGDGVCATASCRDGQKNQNETAADCGGPCPPCGAGQPCAGAADCQSGVCAGGDACSSLEPCCQPPSCSDGVRNGDEVALDCGASDPACRRCAGEVCARDEDCVSGSCVGERCSACGDGLQNGAESDVDCGEGCRVCEAGQACNVDADCASGACQDGSCCGGVLVDCTRCARRLSRTLACDAIDAAAALDCEAFLDCLADNPELCPIRHSPGCSDDPAGVCNHTRFGGNEGPGVALADAILGTTSCYF